MRKKFLVLGLLYLFFFDAITLFHTCHGHTVEHLWLGQPGFPLLHIGFEIFLF